MRVKKQHQSQLLLFCFNFIWSFTITTQKHHSGMCSCKHSYCIPECFSSLSRVWCLSWGVGGVLLWFMWECLFSFQLQVFGSVGVETPDLQIYHVNEEGIYKMRNSTEANTLIVWNRKFFVPWRRVVWVLACLEQQQLWQQVTGKKGKLLKWMEGSMEAQTGMANNPFLAALHNARSQRTRERRRATVLAKENNK